MFLDGYTLETAQRRSIAMRIIELTVMLASSEPERLAAFYENVLQLERVPNYHDPVFQLGGSLLRIIHHSAVHGTNQMPARCQLNLFVADAMAECARLTAQVTFVRPPEREPWGGIVATLADPDGNYIQLIQTPPK